jgi:hypothetical protein
LKLVAPVAAVIAENLYRSMLDHHQALATSAAGLSTSSPVSPLGHGSNLVLKLPRFAATGWRVLVVNVMGGTQSGPQQSMRWASICGG